MDPESQHLQYLYFGYNSEIFTGNILIYVVLFLLIIIVNSLIYAGKTALLEISEKELRELEKSYPEKTKIINELNKRPKKFAASILICTTFLNIALIVFGDLLIKSWLGSNVNTYIGSWVNRNLFNEYFDAAATGNTLITLLSILFITFVIALFGSLLPEKHATSHKINILSLMARPLLLIDKVTFPLNEILLKLSILLRNSHYIESNY